MAAASDAGNKLTGPTEPRAEAGPQAVAAGPQRAGQRRAVRTCISPSIYIKCASAAELDKKFFKLVCLKGRVT
jgi:hypothetical protein